MSPQRIDAAKNESAFISQLNTDEAQMKNVTIYEIAEKANVSIATVSRAIHSPNMLSEKTYKKIKQVMEENNYIYNEAAANFSKKKSNAVCVLVPHITSSVFSRSISAIQKVLYEKGYYLVTANTEYDAEIERRRLQQIKSQRFAGLLMFGFSIENTKQIIELHESGMHILVMWEHAIDPLNYVGFDNYKVTRIAVEHLLNLGHRKIGFILGPYSKVGRANQRYLACRDIINEHRLSVPEHCIQEAFPTIEDGKKKMKEMLQSGNIPTAIYCNNDLQAIGAIHEIHNFGLKVPGDISVCGYDDIEIAQYFSPALTTIHVKAYEIGKISAQELIHKIEKNDKGRIEHDIPASLIVRDSCSQL
jgi:DNA-binding LacI/PurR family transcriptional regulator